jgi:hypothetical protein
MLAKSVNAYYEAFETKYQTFHKLMTVFGNHADY